MVISGPARASDCNVVADDLIWFVCPFFIKTTSLYFSIVHFTLSTKIEFAFKHKNLYASFKKIRNMVSYCKNSKCKPPNKIAI